MAAAALGTNGATAAGGSSAEASPQLRAQYAQPVSILSGLPPAAGSGNARPAGLNYHHEIAKDIGQQVEMMILQAKRNSETKVSSEVQKIKIKIESMSAKLKLVQSRIEKLDPTTAGPILKADLQKSITKLEEVWEGEVGTLKHELWQTIQAHNHNADLMKHHKDAIDQIQARMTENVPNPELESVHNQLLQLNKFVQKEEAQQQKMDQLISRFQVLQQSLSWGFPPSAIPGLAPPHPGAMPGVAVPGGAAAAAAVAGKKAKSKGKAKAAAKVSAANLAPTLRAEAPEFVPTSVPDL